MVKAEITKKDGTHIIIEGSEDEVKNIINAISSNHFHTAPPDKPHKSQIIKPKDKLSIPILIDELKEEGFFSVPRGLTEIKMALEQKGRIYPLSTLSGKVVKKVQARELGRIKEDDKWKYVVR